MSNPANKPMKLLNMLPLVGMGFDVHRFNDVAEDELISIPLCGVMVKHNRQIIAHSDGDVGLHALTDAILGAIGEGDIGKHFPPSDQRWHNTVSSVFVEKAMELARKQSIIMINADLTIIAEKPIIRPYVDQMRQAIATLVSLPVKRVNVKATTTEKMGFIGRKEGIAAQAIVSMVQQA